jgi:hypothetical protein
MAPRRLALAIAVLAVGAGSAGCMTGVPYCCAIVMPARYDAGTAVTTGRRGVGTHLAAGLSWASGDPDPKTAYDVTLGGLLDVRGEAEPAAAPAARMTSPNAPGRYVYGGYLGVDRRVHSLPEHRVFVGLRGEVLLGVVDERDDPLLGVGVTARSAWEWFRAGKGRTWSGSLAAGVFIEATVRAFSGGAIEHAMVTGVSFRLPMTFLETR